MSKIGEPLSQDVSSAGYDEFLTRKYEGLGGEPGESQGYSYDELVANAESPKVQNFTTTIAFTSTDYRTVTWSTGTISYQDGLVTPEIATSNTGAMTSRTYIYFDPQASKVALAITTTAVTATQGERLLLAIAVPNANTAGKAEIQTFGATGAYVANLTVEHLTSGSIRSKTVTLVATADAGDCYFNAGKTDFTNTDSGFILGIDDSDSDKAKFYIGDATNYLNWDGGTLSVKGAITATSGSFTGAISASTIDIGGADATSFHVDVDGNMWSGNAAFASAPFKVSSAGALTTKSVTIKDSGDTTIIDATGVVSTALSTFSGSSNNSLNQVFTDQTETDVTGSSLEFTLSRSSVVLIFATVSAYTNNVSGSTANLVVRVKLDSTDKERMIWGEGGANEDLSTSSTHFLETLTAATYTLKLTGDLESWTSAATATLYQFRLSYIIVGT